MSDSPSAGSYELGRLIARIEPPKETFVAIVIILFGFFCTGISSLATLGVSSSGAVVLWIMAGVGLLIVIIVAVYMVQQHRSGRKIVTLYEDGLTYGPVTMLPAVMHWDEVAEYRVRVLQKIFITPHSLHMRSVYRLTLTGKDGRVIEIKDRHKRMNMVADALWRMITAKLTPPALDAFNRGGTMSFGPLSVSLKGISSGSKFLNWDQVSQVVIRGGYVVVQVRPNSGSASWERIRVEDVPNLPVFAALIESPTVEKLRPPINLVRTAFGV